MKESNGYQIMRNMGWTEWNFKSNNVNLDELDIHYDSDREIYYGIDKSGKRVDFGEKNEGSIRKVEGNGSIEFKGIEWWEW